MIGDGPLLDVDEVLLVLAGGARMAEGEDGSEALDQLAHALQSADLLTASHPADLELQVAGLVHDIGHLLYPGDDAGHGCRGAAAVSDLLGHRVARLVELHVPAKRYLVATDPDYAKRLSPVSTVTLGRQGGMMTGAEVAAFAAAPDLEAALALRRADEGAKVPGRPVPGLDRWDPVLRQVART